MILKLKAFGVTVIAVLALSAVAASTAGAASFTASSYPTAAASESALGNDDLKTEAGTIECRVKKHFHSLTSVLWGAWTKTATYTECKAFGFLSATFNMNGCGYGLYPSGKMDISCPAGKSMELTAGTCKVTIGAQSGLSSVALSNSGNGISEKANVGGIAYTVVTDGFGCPFGGTGAKTGATYTQNSAVQISSTNGAKIDIG